MKFTAINIKSILLTILALVAISAAPGCGLLIAEIDTDMAIAEAAAINVQNIRTIVEIKSTEHLDAAQDIDSSLINKMRASSGGAEAVDLFEAYQRTVANNQEYDRREIETYKKALSNAILIADLVGQRIALRARWNALAGRIPAIRTIRDTAEHTARRYVETIGQPLPSNILPKPPDQ